jgi:thioredoxin-like negative regulator of GroEL
MKNAEKQTLHRFTSENWERLVLNAKKPVFVDFRLPERPSFIIGSPDLVRLRQEWEGEAEVGYLDVSRHLELALKYPVVDLPTLSLFYRGRVLRSFVGATRFHQDFRGFFNAFTPRVSPLASMTMIIGKPL